MSRRDRLLSRTVRGLAAASVGNGITLVVQVVSIPLFVGNWGSELFGEWLLLSTIPAYFALSDFGFGSAAGNEMTMRVATGDKRGALVVFQSVWLLVTVLPSFFAAIIATSIWALPFEEWLNLHRIDHASAVITTILLILYMLVGLQGGLVAAGYRCVGKYARGTMLANVVRLAEFIALAVALSSGGGPVSAATAYLLVRLLGTVGIWRDLFRQAPWLRVGIAQADTLTLKRLAAPAIAFLGFPAGNALAAQGIATVVGIVLGPVTLVVYTTARTLVGSLRQLATAINATVWPEVSMAYANRDFALMRRIHRYACQASLWLTLLGVVVLFIVGERTVQVWTAGRVGFDEQFFRLMLLSPVVGTLWFTSSVIPAATNQHAGIAAAYVVGTGGSLLVAAALAPAIGLSGVAAALLLTDAAMAAYVLRTSLALLHEDGPTFLRSQLSLAPLANFARLLKRDSPTARE